MSIKVAIRPGCNGMGSCQRLAPGVFRIDAASGRAEVLVEDATAAREAVLAAARACPFVAVEIDGVPVDEPVDSAVVVACERPIPDVLELVLRRPGFAFTPGQYVFLRLRDGEGEFFRTDSVVAVRDGQVTLCIRLVPNGRAGKVLTTVRPGAVLGLSRAKGLFALQSPDRPKLFVTGGTGIAPVVPMCAAAPAARKLVIIGARTPKDLFWADRLRAMPNTEVVEIVQQGDAGWTGPVGLVTAPLESLDPAAWPEVYTCGSPGMVEAVRRTLVARGTPADAIHADSFVAANNAGQSKAALPAVHPTPGRDWAGLLRRLHYIVSAPLAALFLFYALTGFIANRSDWFHDGDTAQAEATLPATAGLDRDHLVPVLEALLPQRGDLTDFIPEANPRAVFTTAAGRRWEVRVDAATRQVRMTEHGVVPPGIPWTAAGLAGHFAQGHGGDADLEGASVEDGTIELELASVWGTHHVTATEQDRSWTMASVQPPLVVSLVDLHRGKHAGAWQRMAVDATALVLAFVTLSGATMALLAAAPRRRRQAALLLAASVALLLFLLLAR